MAIEPLVAARAAYVLGWTNIIGLLLVILSCRCVMNIKPEMLTKSKLYIAFYRYHCYYWWLFIISVLAHAILAITAFGNPFV
jgi:hypothetical protein